MEIRNENVTNFNNINLLLKNFIKQPQTNQTTENDMNFLNIGEKENLELILSEIGFSSSPINLEMINILSKNSFPINKETMMNLKQISNLFEFLPLEKAEFLLKNLKDNIEINKDFTKQLDDYIYKNINIDNQIKSVFSSIEDTESIKEIISIFTKNEKLSQFGEKLLIKLGEIKNEIKADINVRLNKNPDIIKDFFNKFDYNNKESTPNILEKTFNEVFKKLIENSSLDFKGGDLAQKSVTNSKNAEIFVKEFVDKILPDKLLFDKKAFDSFKSLLEEFENKKDITFEKDILNFPILKKSFSEIREVLPKILNFQVNFNKRINFNFQNSKPKDLNKFFENLSEKLEDTKQVLNKISNFEKVKTSLNEIENINKNIDFMNSLKDSTFIQIPLNINDYSTNAEIFIFNNEKNNKKDKSKSGSSALISLDLLNLGHIEAYLNKFEENISCQFRLINTSVQKLIKENLNILDNYLKSKNLNLKEVSFKKIDESFTFISQKNNENFDNKKLNLNSFNKQA